MNILNCLTYFKGINIYIRQGLWETINNEVGPQVEDIRGNHFI